VSELRAVQARLEEEVRENGTSLDVARDKEGELTAELKALRLKVEELQLAKATAVSDDREKRKAEMLSEMMAKIETVRTARRRWEACHSPSRRTTGWEIVRDRFGGASVAACPS
jgi:hypothetical protein